MSDINCPYCEAAQDINHDDGYGYEEGVSHEQQCEECDKYFTFTTSVSFYYDVEKADCLNDGKHNFKASRTWPIENSEMKCTTCEERRTPTEEEMKEIIKLK